MKAAGCGTEDEGHIHNITLITVRACVRGERVDGKQMKISEGERVYVDTAITVLH